MDLQDAEMGTVLRSFSEYAGISIVPGPEVRGLVTVKLDDVPWRDALEIVLRAHGFSAVEESGVIRIGGSQRRPGRKRNCCRWKRGWSGSTSPTRTSCGSR